GAVRDRFFRAQPDAAGRFWRMAHVAWRPGRLRREGEPGPSEPPATENSYRVGSGLPARARRLDSRPGRAPSLGLPDRSRALRLGLVGPRQSQKNLPLEGPGSIRSM